jgi:hypothetical protein
MSVGEIYRLTVVMSGPQGQDIVNQFTAEETAGFVVGFENNAAALIDAFQNDVEAFYAGCFHSTTKIVQYRAANVTTGLEVAELVLSSPVAGGLGGESLAPQVSAEVIWKTGLPGRRNRGKTYLPPGSETYSNGGEWLSAYASSVDAFANELASFGNAVTNGGWKHVVYSAVAAAARDRTSYRLWPYARTQRRRAYGIGS